MAEVVRTAPAEFIEAGAKTYLDDLTKAIGTFKTTDLSTIMGPQFVAGPGALTTQAEQLATGLGGFQPFLTQAQQLRGPTAYQAYMSPFQQDVIDTTLAEFDRQAAQGLQQLRDQAVAAGAFGGGREGVQRAEFLSNQARNRAALQAQLLQQGFGQAQNLLAQDFVNKKRGQFSTTNTCITRSTDFSTNRFRRAASGESTTRFNSATTIIIKTSFTTIRSSATIWFWCYTINCRISW